jgi:myo-inositol-1(or 4)-monophosphatase
MLASGRADIMLDPIMNQWDLMPLIPIIRGAGGVITDWHGGDPVTGNSIVAAGPGLHSQVLEILR